MICWAFWADGSVHCHLYLLLTIPVNSLFKFARLAADSSIIWRIETAAVGDFEWCCCSVPSRNQMCKTQVARFVIQMEPGVKLLFSVMRHSFVVKRTCENWRDTNSHLVPRSPSPSCWEFTGGLVSSKPATVASPVCQWELIFKTDILNGNRLSSAS